MKLRIGYFYPKLLNLYGDNGNVEILKYRAEARGIDVEVIPVSIKNTLNKSFMNQLDFIFMGGGPDSSQVDVQKDLKHKKAPFIKEYIENGGFGL